MDHILVVDDEETVKDAVKYVLERFGYEVKVASNGKEGFEYFSRCQCLKLVITDIRMPFMDGIKLAGLIRDSDRPDMPIIAITAHFGREKIKKGLFDYVLGKPFNLLTLEKIVKQILES